jgi:hypothetical protein
MGLIPGIAIAGPAMGLPLSVLAAFIERPFVTLSGVRPHALWYALQANLVSLLVGYVGLFGAAVIVDASKLWGPNDALFMVWPFVAVALSAIVERSYLAARTRPGRVTWGWIVLGNVLSAAMCVGLLFLVVFLRREFRASRLVLAPCQDALHLVAGLGSIGVYVAAFRITRRRADGGLPVSQPTGGSNLSPNESNVQSRPSNGGA